MINNGDVSPTLMSNSSEDVVRFEYPRVRRLTPREYWRLMGFDDCSFNKAQSVCSDTQLYKQAGNSICVPVLEAVFKELFKEDK